ncbi:MAG: hypothetical protein KGL39_00625 [Patescibacteria group bacterium]|nr:hypothetical protein [Patescibacteria group bacterium]
MSFYDYFREVLSLFEETEKLIGVLEVAKSAGWWLPYQRICWVSERHNVLNRDERGRLHCENGPALSYPDGFSIWAWHGMRVVQKVIEKPSTITLKDIDEESNVEIRRVLLERFGLSRYLREGHVELIDKIANDDTRVPYGVRGAKLLRKEITGDEPLVMVLLKNSTKEPDNSVKDYAIRVPPDMKSCIQAVAWTHGKVESEYNPLVET